MPNSNDLTLLYYTDNKICDCAGQKIRDNILKVTENKYPIISVSQKPIDFGQNICIGEIGKSKYNMYKQVLIGVREVKTKYVACIEDDTLYSPEHFLFRPPEITFAYETNYWFAQKELDYFWRVRNIDVVGGGMWGCITESEILRNNLTKRFEVYPVDPTDKKSPNFRRVVWGEPGINDEAYGLHNRSVKFSSPKPCVIFIHDNAMGSRQFKLFYKRYGMPLPEDRAETLEQFGSVKDVFNNFWEGK